MTEIITINTKGVVPNHLNDTNIFCRYANNTIIEVLPKEVHFAGYKLNERNYQEIKFTNISDEISRFNIIPPVSKYFRLKYNKPERMVPGFFVKCTVIFTPDKARNYNDFIKIHTKDSKNNIIVPIYAYPAIKGLQVPRNMTFPVTPIGKKCQKQLKLHSDSDIDFDYEIVIVKDHPSIIIHPLSGVIPARSDAPIILQFQPTDYTTCEKTINIYVSQYNFKPIVCTLIGTSEPGLERKQLTEQAAEISIVNSDLASISKLELRRKIPMPESQLKSITDSKENTSLVQVNRKSLKKQIQTKFETRLRENVTSEKQNQLRWQTCRGVQPTSEQDIDNIRQNQEMHLKEYNLRIRKQEALFECYENVQINKSNWNKTIRFDSEEKDFDYSVKTPQFVPECWMVRKSIIDRFRSAAWKVIINNRLKIRLKKLIESGGNYQKIDNSHLHPGGESLTFYRSLNGIAEELLPTTQLTCDNNFDMSEYRLMLPLQPHYQYLDLHVPLQMQVLNYERIDTSSLTYQPLNSGFKMKSPSTIETTIEATEDAPVCPITFSRGSEVYSCSDKDTTLTSFPQNCSFVDDYSNFPLYYYQNELLEDKEPIDMDWKIAKSSFLMCKKLINANSKSRCIGKTLESCLIPERVPTLMTKEDLDKLGYDISSNVPVIDVSMMNVEFPILNSLKESLEKKWNS